MRSLAIAVLLASATGCTLEFDRALLERTQGGGCTDGVNRLPGNTPQACGNDGAVCAQCVSPLSACEAGACVVPNAAVALALGEAHSSALDRNGTLWLWGANRAGAVGLPAEVVEQHLPVALSAPGFSWSAAALGGRIPELHSCAIAEPGELYCWGSNGDGQTGLGSAQPGPVPTRVGNRGGLDGDQRRSGLQLRHPSAGGALLLGLWRRLQAVGPRSGTGRHHDPTAPAGSS